jgi:hypothetical protein
VLRDCDQCGNPYVARRQSSRYCGSDCRVAAHRQAKRGDDVAPKPKPKPAPEPVDAPVPPEPTPEPTPGAVRAATLAELERAGRVDTPAGQTALALAELIDAPPPLTWSSVAGWAREHRASLAEALRDVKPAAARSTLDEIKARRDAKRLGA